MNIKFEIKNWHDVRWLLETLMGGRFISSWSRSGEWAECYIKDAGDLNFVLRLLKGVNVSIVEVQL